MDAGERVIIKIGEKLCKPWHLMKLRHLVDLIDAAAAGAEVFITKDKDISVQLVPRTTKKREYQFGSAKGLISIFPGFDEPLEDFNEYTELSSRYT